MGKAVTDGFLDGGLDAISNANVMTLCTAEPTSIAECDSLSLIPGHPLSGVDFTKANGDVSGRKVTVAQQPDLTVDIAGTINHVVINDGTDFYVTTSDPKPVSISDDVTVPAWDIEFADPT